MFVNNLELKKKTVIFTGFKVNWVNFGDLAMKIDFISKDSEADYCIVDSNYYVGKMLVLKFEEDEVIDFSLDELREYSTNDAVRKVRFALMKVDEKFNEVYPQLYLISL